MKKKKEVLLKRGKQNRGFIIVNYFKTSDTSETLPLVEISLKVIHNSSLRINVNVCQCLLNTHRKGEENVGSRKELESSTGYLV